METTTTHAPSTQRLPLPVRWVQKVFAEMQGNYGSRFLDMWRTGQTMDDGSDVGVNLAMAKWGEKLAGFADRPELIRKALGSLPPHPPTLPEFVALCRQQHGDTQKALPAPSLTVEEVAPRIAAIARKVAKPPSGDTAWAKGDPPAVRGPWEAAIIDLAARGDPRFVAILREHVANRVIRSERARAVLEGPVDAVAV